MNDDQLRQWYQARARRPLNGNHPPADALVRLVRQEGAESERLAVLDHVLQCAECGPEFELLRAIERAHPPSRRWSFPVWLPLAAAVVLAIGTTVWWRGGREPVVVRGTASSGPRMIDPADSVLAPNAPLRFRWHASPGASRYRFELLQADGALLFASEGSDTVVQVPDSLRPAPGSYRWLLQATGYSAAPVQAIGTVILR